MLIHQETVMPVVPFALIILYKNLKRNHDIAGVINGIKNSVAYQFDLAKYTGGSLTTKPLSLSDLLLDENILPEFENEETDEKLLDFYEFGLTYESAIVQSQVIINYYETKN